MAKTISMFDDFLDRNADLKDAARKFAVDMLGKDATEKAIINVMVVFTMGAVWQADQTVKAFEEKGFKV